MEPVIIKPNRELTSMEKSLLSLVNPNDKNITKMKDSSFYTRAISKLQQKIRLDATSQISEHIKSNLHPKAYQIWMEQSPFDYPSKVSNFLDPFIARIFTEFMIPTENGDVDEISYSNGVLSITRINAEGNAEAKTSFSILNKALQGYLLSDEYSELVEKSNQFEREDRNTRLLWIGGGLASATALYFLLRKKS